MGEMIVGSSRKVMEGMESESFKVIITSPPYNIRTGRNAQKGRSPTNSSWTAPILENGYGNCTDDMPDDAYALWQRNCLWEMMRLIPDDGAIFYNHKWRIQEGLMQDRHDIVEGFPVRQVIIWDRNGCYNWNPGYFPQHYEVIYLIAKPDFKMNGNHNRHGDIWTIKPDAHTAHPAPFPVALPERILSCVEDGPVLDPFMGSGSTAVAAARQGREWIGIDNCQEYANMTLERVRAATSQVDMIGFVQEENNE